MDVKVRIRDGCRGGQEQFKWKDQWAAQDFKDREQYLGGTTKMGMMGKFGRYYLHDWYHKKREGVTAIDDEMDAVKAYEEELMQEALGLKPKKLLLAKKQMDEQELKEFLSKDKPEGRRGRDQMGPQSKIVNNEFGEQVTEDDYVGKAYLESTIKGLGFASHRTAKLEEYKAQALGTEAKLEGCKDEGPIKIEEGDGFVKMEFGRVKSESSVKKEPVVKMEPGLKEELKQEPGSSSSASGLKVDPADVKSEDEKVGERVLKREREGDAEADDERVAKKAAKDDKKRKKAEKKRKKALKKLKKLSKKAKKAEKISKKAKRKESSGSSNSSDSS